MLQNENVIRLILSSIHTEVIISDISVLVDITNVNVIHPLHEKISLFQFISIWNLGS